MVWRLIRPKLFWCDSCLVRVPNWREETFGSGYTLDRLANVKVYSTVDIPANQEGPQPTGVTVSATDDDAGANAEITYSILEEEARLYFQVTSDRGQKSRDSTPV